MKKLGSLVLALAMLISSVNVTVLMAQAQETPASPGDKLELYLCIGSPIAMSGGKIIPLDRENPDLVPLLHQGRTLVPLRFISEHFGAEVDYDAKARTGIVTIGTTSAAFPVGERYFTRNGTRVAIDTETLERDGRIFLPLRVIAEELFSLQVDYQEDLIVLTGQKMALDQELLRQIKAQIGSYVKLQDLEQLKAYFKDKDVYRYDYELVERGPGETYAVPEEGMGDGAPMPTAAPEAAPNQDALSTGNAQESDYSATNVQVEGVDESDIVKTDGAYIYLLGGAALKIVRAGERMTLAGELNLDEDCYFSEMYVDGDRLILIGSRYEGGGRFLPGNPGILEEPGLSLDRSYPYPYYGKNFTLVQVYDMEDKSELRLLRSFEVEGSVSASRKQGDYLYLATALSVWGRGEDPRPYMGENGTRIPIPVDDIMIMPACPAEQLLTLSAIHVKDAEEPVESETIVHDGGTTYMSHRAMYIAGYQYDRGEDFLSIAKFSIDGSRIGYAGAGKVAGYLNDQFSMDENNGYLRVATTVWDSESSNNLYVLDGNMQVCGAVKGFAPEESIYSARFLGDRGYIVTFRQIDPLFVFDLSDPEQPAITGELKVPGFSSYLHPVAEDVILGVGNDVYDIYAKDRSGKEVVIGQRTGGIKLSLFDVSDMGKPREIDTLILGESGYAELLYNHKAAMFQKSEDRLGFTAYLGGFEKGSDWSGALLISYADNRLRELGRIASAAFDDEIMEESGEFYFGSRLVYIGDILYYAEGGVIRSFDFDSLRELQSLRLQ